EHDGAGKRPNRPRPARAPPRRDVPPAIPLPRARPASAGAVAQADTGTQAGPEPQTATFDLASASSSPVQTPADIINSRGFWENDTRAAAPDRDGGSDARAMIRVAQANPQAPLPAASLPAAAPPAAPPPAVGPAGERPVWNAAPHAHA